MKTLKIYGASDDLIETSGIPGADEFYAGTNEPICGKIEVKSSSGTVVIICSYYGSWAFAIHAVDGDADEMPPWPVRRKFGTDVGYSETVEIDVPDDTIMTYTKLNEQ